MRFLSLVCRIVEPGFEKRVAVLSRFRLFWEKFAISSLHNAGQRANFVQPNEIGVLSRELNLLFQLHHRHFARVIKSSV